MLSFYVLLKFFSGSTAFTLSELLAAVFHEACAAAILISAIFFQRGTTRAVLKLYLARVLSHSHAPHEVGVVCAPLRPHLTHHTSHELSRFLCHELRSRSILGNNDHMSSSFEWLDNS